MSGPARSQPHPSALGLAYGVAAYGLWGFMPLYIKAVRAVPVLEVLCHRVVWALVLLLPIVWRQRQLGALLAAVTRRRTRAMLAVSSLAIAVNWLVYIWAVVHGRMLEASLGYYINPLVNVLLGVVVLGERLDRPVRAAVGIAAVGVAWLTLRLGQPPLIALVLAASFGLYGLMRKLAPVGALAGLAIETAMLLPFAGSYLVWAVLTGHTVFLAGRPALDLLLLLAGPVTAIPLLCFAGAARRLPLSTMGFLQYLSPTLQLLLAVLVFGEPFDRSRAVAFAFIWTALAVFAIHSAKRGTPEPVTDA